MSAAHVSKPARMVEATYTYRFEQSVSAEELSNEALAVQRGRYFAGLDADGANIMKAKARPLAAATINRYQAALSAVLTWSQRRRIAPIRTWPRRTSAS